MKTVISLFTLFPFNLTHALFISLNCFLTTNKTMTVLSSVGFTKVERAANGDPVSKTLQQKSFHA